LPIFREIILLKLWLLTEAKFCFPLQLLISSVISENVLGIERGVHLSINLGIYTYSL